MATKKLLVSLLFIALLSWTCTSALEAEQATKPEDYSTNDANPDFFHQPWFFHPIIPRPRLGFPFPWTHPPQPSPKPGFGFPFPWAHPPHPSPKSTSEQSEVDASSEQSMINDQFMTNDANTEWFFHPQPWFYQQHPWFFPKPFPWAHPPFAAPKPDFGHPFPFPWAHPPHPSPKDSTEVPQTDSSTTP